MRTGNGPGWIKKAAANEPKSRRSGNYLRRSEIKRLFCGERVLWNLQIQKHQKLSRLMEEKEHHILETHNCPFSLKHAGLGTSHRSLAKSLCQAPLFAKSWTRRFIQFLSHPTRSLARNAKADLPLDRGQLLSITQYCIRPSWACPRGQTFILY